ncbi:hypothetical protein NKH52_06425 [Mesorhizobium sp. M1066]|uniref:hypothetical protein n=1 Tax=unclassified Mesorhizobium TaxID=325217 RepID=UPI00333A5545
MHGDYLAVSIAATTHQWLMDEAVSNLSGKWRPDESPSVQLEPERYTVYCADNRIEVSLWNLEQMKVRRSSNVCQFQSYTSYSSALNFAQKNFGGEGEGCSC